jgi:hypothetical protein
MKNVEPVEYAGEFVFKVFQKVKVKPQNVEAIIVNKQSSTIGILYEVETADNRFWITEDHLE